MGFIGDLFGGGGGTSVNVPGPSAEEKDLMRTQTDLLKRSSDVTDQQLRQASIFLPLQLQQMGITGDFDDEGELIGAEIDPEFAELDALRKDIEEGFLERTQQALAGELPIDSSLLRELEEGRSSLSDVLRKNLGSGFETSTPGIESLADFDKRAIELKEGARRGDLSLAEQLGMARETSNQARVDNFLARSQGSQAPFFQSANTLRGLAGGFGEAQQPYQQQRAQQTQLAIAQAKAAGDRSSGLFGALGQMGASFLFPGSGAVAGNAFGAYAAPF